MVTVYQIKAEKNLDNVCKGFSIENSNLDNYLKNKIRKLIYDIEGTEQLISELQSTDFSESQLKQIFSLESQNELLKNFRIGEALVEVLLAEHFEVVFYWNSLRDETNPYSNRTGVDIIGFQSRNGVMNFVFIEVKTSNDVDAPPSVAYSLTKQLEDLVNIDHVSKNAIRCLGFKAKANGFIDSFREALKEFMNKRYIVTGGLVRDTEPNELDVKSRFLKLDKDTPNDIHVQMYSFYFLRKIEKWTAIVTEKEEPNA